MTGWVPTDGLQTEPLFPVSECIACQLPTTDKLEDGICRDCAAEAARRYE